MKVYALLSVQGTACAETALREDEYQDETTRQIVETQRGSDVTLTWADCTGNDVIEEACGL